MKIKVNASNTLVFPYVPSLREELNTLESIHLPDDMSIEATFYISGDHLYNVQLIVKWDHAEIRAQSHHNDPNVLIKELVSSLKSRLQILLNSERQKAKC